MHSGIVFALALAGAPSASAASAGEEDSGPRGWISGQWKLTVGVTAMVAPDFEGGGARHFKALPIISLGKVGPEARFVSRNDNISLALLDTGAVRAGVAGRFVMPRDGDTANALQGLDPVPWGVEAGAFAEFYPTDFIRVRGEIRRGIRAHDGFVGDVSADAFVDVMPKVRVSGGPRVAFASQDYFETYYGVDAEEAAASGLSEYQPGGGIKSAGVGGAVSWRATDRVTTTLFGEYSRLMGAAAESSLVRERGSRNQLTFGLSATYRFDFEM